MLVLVDLMVFAVVVAPELGVASSHGVGGFLQVVAEIAVAGFNHTEVLCLEFTGLVFVLDKAGKLGTRGLVIEAVDIANLSNDAGRVNLAYPGNRRQCVWDNFKLLFNGLIRYLRLLL